MRRTLLTVVTFVICAAGVGAGTYAATEPRQPITGTDLVVSTVELPAEPVARGGLS